MYKIRQNTDNDGNPIKDRYTLHCYFQDSSTNTCKEIWNVSGLTEQELIDFLKKNTNKELETDFGFVVLKSGNGPVVLAYDGELRPAPVKKNLEIIGGLIEKAKSAFFGRSN